jgi:hypothetical protein
VVTHYQELFDIKLYRGTQNDLKYYSIITGKYEGPFQAIIINVYGTPYIGIIIPYKATADLPTVIDGY